MYTNIGPTATYDQCWTKRNWDKPGLESQNYSLIVPGLGFAIILTREIAEEYISRCSLKYLFRGHCPPGKHKIAKKIYCRRGKNYRSLFKVSCFCFPGEFSFVFRRIRPIMVAPSFSFLIRQKRLSWENSLSPPSWMEKYRTLSWLGEWNIYFPSSSLTALEYRNETSLTTVSHCCPGREKL